MTEPQERLQTLIAKWREEARWRVTAPADRRSRKARSSAATLDCCASELQTLLDDCLAALSRSPVESEPLQQAARLLREWAGERQQSSGKWTTREQAGVECAIRLEQIVKDALSRSPVEPPAKAEQP